ncbi:Ycf51 family protein [Desertifilum tharense]|nr:Ycf51 family protein [Desertifilum tharense]
MMSTTLDFIVAAKWAGIATVASAAIAALGFLFQWGIRFRLVGVTGFMGVLTAGLFALGLVPFTRTQIPGSIHYTVVFDNGGPQAVIALPPEVTDDQLTATLKQAASDLFSPGRVGRGDTELSIRARSLVHPDPKVTRPLYFAEVKRSLFNREDDTLDIRIDSEKLALARQIAGVNLEESGKSQRE